MKIVGAIRESPLREVIFRVMTEGRGYFLRNEFVTSDLIHCPCTLQEDKAVRQSCRPEPMLRLTTLGRQSEEVCEAAADTCGVETVRTIMLRTAAVTSILSTADTERQQTVGDIV